MSIPRLNPLEKTSIQARQTIKRLEMLIQSSKDPEEREIAHGLIRLFNAIRDEIPFEYQDTDLKKEED